VAVLAVLATGGVIAWQRYGGLLKGKAEPDQVAKAPEAAASAVPPRSTDAPRRVSEDRTVAEHDRAQPADGLVEVAQPGAAPPAAGEQPTPVAAVVQGDDSAVERATLNDAIKQITPGNSAYEATEALLHSWGAHPLAPAEASSPTLDLPRIARSRGLEYLALQGNLNLLRVLDLPAILELVPEDGSAARFVTVEHMGEDVVTVSAGRAPIQISTDVLGDAWFGKAHLFWQDVDHLGPMLSVGASSPAVGRLHELLKAAGVYGGAPTSVFAASTEEAVLRFQRSKRLVADGKVGPMTMIALYQSAPGDRLPHLGVAPQKAEGGGDRFSALPGGPN